MSSPAGPLDEELLSYQHKNFAVLLREDELGKLKADAERFKKSLAGLDSEKKKIESQIETLKQSQQRLMRFLEQFTC